MGMSRRIAELGEKETAEIRARYEEKVENSGWLDKFNSIDILPGTEGELRKIFEIALEVSLQGGRNEGMSQAIRMMLDNEVIWGPAPDGKVVSILTQNSVWRLFFPILHACTTIHFKRYKPEDLTGELRKAIVGVTLFLLELMKIMDSSGFWPEGTMATLKIMSLVEPVAIIREFHDIPEEKVGDTIVNLN
jgi:hypothetical protein